MKGNKIIIRKIKLNGKSRSYIAGRDIIIQQTYDNDLLMKLINEIGELKAEVKKLKLNLKNQ